jgi:hypothetical protein
MSIKMLSTQSCCLLTKAYGEILGFQGGENNVLPGFGDVWTELYVPTLRRNISLHLQSLSWRQCVSPKLWHLPASLYGAEIQKKKQYNQEFTAPPIISGCLLT